MRVNIFFYSFCSLLFLLIGYFVSDRVIKEDKNTQLIIGSARVIYNMDYGFYELKDLDFKVSQLINVSTLHYSHDTKLVTFKDASKKLVEKKFSETNNKLSDLDKSLKKIIIQKYEYNTNLINKFMKENLKFSESIDDKISNMDNYIENKAKFQNEVEKNTDYVEFLKNKMIIMDKEIEAQTYAESNRLYFGLQKEFDFQEYNIYVNNLADESFNHNFIKLSDIEYNYEHLNINNYSKIIVIILFLAIGLFFSWCILEIRSFYLKRNSA